MEWRVKRLVNSMELVFQAIHLILILNLGFLETRNFIAQLAQISLATFNVLLAFHKENLLLLVVLFYRLRETIFSVLKHLYH